MKVYLDDMKERKTPIGWHRAWTAEEAIKFLETGNVTEIDLDHDLEDQHYAGTVDERTGYTVVEWLEKKVRSDPNFLLPIIKIHTFNPEGRKRMENGLNRITEYLRTGR